MGQHGEELVDRTYRFARDVRRVVNQLPRTVASYEDSKQVIRSSGSVASNYLEAQEGMSRKDFFYRIRVCRKEARESQLWLELLTEDADAQAADVLTSLVDEANQLTRIFASIAKKAPADE